MFKETHPILGTRNIQRAIDFYTQQLGFVLAFGDKAEPPNYVGLTSRRLVRQLRATSPAAIRSSQELMFPSRMHMAAHGNHSIHGDAGAFDASTQTVKGETRADGQVQAG